MSNPKHILVIRLSAMGDVAITVPILRQFTKQYPSVKLTILTREFYKPFFSDLPNVSVFAADVKGKHKGIFGLYKLSRELKNLNIDAIKRLTGRISLVKEEEYPRASIQLSVRGKIDNKSEFTQKFMDISHELDVDIAFQEDNIFRRNRRLVCFDMDSTLIQTEVIDELAELAGVGKEVKAITESAMNGEIDFNESYKRRMKLLKGLNEEVLHNVAINLPITKGARRLVDTLHSYGFKTAILSGGFTYFGNYLKEKL